MLPSLPKFIQNSHKYYHVFKPNPPQKEYSARKLVGFSIEEIYSVVSDIKNYMKFVPFCKRSIIIDSSDENELKATLEVGFPPIVENYTSDVTLRCPNYVRAVCKDGKLFNHLETIWQFSPGLKSNPRTCIIDFQIKFEFKSILHTKIALLFFDSLANQMEGAFLEEARNRFGNPSIPMHKLTVTKGTNKKTNPH